MQLLRAAGGAKRRGEAESLVKASALDWTIYQPSLIFGAGDGLVSRFAAPLRRMPVLPLVCTKAWMAPILVGDAAEAIGRRVGSAELGQCFTQKPDDGRTPMCERLVLPFVYMGNAMSGQQGEFSTDWFQHNVPHWERWLATFRGKPGLRALEIGSFEGRSTIWLCQNILSAPTSTIDCADFFQHDPVYGDYHARFRNNTAPWREKITEYAGPSFDALRRVNGPYDIVYIDGWHSAFGALADGVMSWPLLKVGGVMIFDDYLWAPPKLGPPPRPSWLERKWHKWHGRNWRYEALLQQIAGVAIDTPKLGVDGMLATLAGYYDLLGTPYQLALRKTRDFEQGQVGHDT